MDTKNEKDNSGVEVDSVSLRHADDALLAKLGYKSEFKREFSLIETVAFAFSIMGVVASVSSTLSFGLESGGHVGMVFGWLIPCLFVLPVALSMAEMASAMPTSAGFLDGYSCRTLLDYMFLGWANITGQTTLVCSIDWTLALMISSAVSVMSDGSIILSSGANFGILLAILFLHGIVCSAATSILARLNLFYNKVSTKDAFTLFENNTGWANNGWAFILSFTAPMWTLTGYDSAAHISEEVAGAAKAAPIAIIVGVGATASLGWILLIAVSFVIPSVSDLISTPLPLPMAQVFLDVLGKKGMLAIWSLIIVVQFVTGAAQGVDASRVVFAFSRDNALPGSHWWKQVNPYTQTPVNAVWLVMLVSAICGVLGFSVTALNSLAGSAVIGLYTSYAFPIFLSPLGPFNLGRFGKPIGWIAVAWVCFIIIMLLFPPGSGTTGANMNYAVVIMGAVFVFATAWWMLSAKKWFHGPIKNIDSPDDFNGMEKRSSVE
ncbi:amino acid transporter [Gymnopus androsaceus JB14]|uniref:Amino acid transporter n=1 Tax=Gymnopus androsaceus JB14 TaxID=1447944 RepID=A0A6A4HIX9_9AGAR|nr:amino acid transporter [Gymnopus androsaceus JB14]